MCIAKLWFRLSALAAGGPRHRLHSSHFKCFGAFVIASVTFKEKGKDQDWCGGNCILLFLKTVPRELKGLVTGVYWQKKLKCEHVCFWANVNCICFFPPLPTFLFCFVMITSVPSYEFWATSKASFITINCICCWQRTFWLFRHAGKACMASHWPFLDAASHSTAGCCTWVAWQLPRITPFQRGLGRCKSFLFTRKHLITISKLQSRSCFSRKKVCF